MKYEIGDFVSKSVTGICKIEDILYLNPQDERNNILYYLMKPIEDKKEKIYNLLKKSQTALEFINGINSMNIDCNLYNALVEAVSADGGFVK